MRELSWRDYLKTFDNADEIVQDAVARIRALVDHSGQIGDLTGSELIQEYGIYNVPDVPVDELAVIDRWNFISPFHRANAFREIVRIWRNLVAKRSLDKHRGKSGKHVAGSTIRMRQGVYAPWKDTNIVQKDDAGREWIEDDKGNR
jgi:hypothetical protein